jgi:hypothetical protein
MNTRFRLLFILIGALLVAATFTYPRWQSFVNRPRTVETGGVLQGLPTEIVPTFQALPPDQQAAYRLAAGQNPQIAIAMIQSALQTPEVVPDDQQALPNMTGPVQVGTGSFKKLDAIRQASGDVIIYQQADNSKVVRFENLGVVNGPDLRVVMSQSSAPDTVDAMKANDSEIDLGQLKGTSGSQNYNVPAELDLSQYDTVVIYSRTLNVVYSYAVLTKF